MTGDDDRMRRLVASFTHVVARLGELGHELDALRLASRQRRARRAERRRTRSDLSLQQVAGALVAPANDERFSAFSLAVTGFDVEAEAGRNLETRLRLRRLGEELADRVPRDRAATARPSGAEVTSPGQPARAVLRPPGVARVRTRLVHSPRQDVPDPDHDDPEGQAAAA